MKYMDVNGIIREDETAQDVLLRRIYNSMWGRICIRPLLAPWVSKAAGAFLDSRWSVHLIEGFIKKNQMDMSPYVKRPYGSFNDFFTREIKPEARMIDYDENALVSPADGKVSVYPLGEHTMFYVKKTCYTVESLLKNKKLAERYRDGYAVIIRLTVDDYHRYCYPSDGRKSKNFRIPGVFHTVNPAACETVPVYKENTREFTLLKTPHFGTILQMEVGALMVGRICNDQEEAVVRKGEEKGRFEFGGSTILLLLEKNCVKLRKDLIENTQNDCETVVQMGQKLNLGPGTWTKVPVPKVSRKNT